MIIARTPFRITLAGGGTDLPSFYEDHGGSVISMAIDKYIYINLKYRLFDDNIRIRYLKDEYVKSAYDLKHDRAKEALIRNNILNNVEITSIADLPAKSGMGSSGSFLVGMLSAIKALKGEQLDLTAICEEACDIEINTLKLPSGKQDQYIAAYGGVKILDIDQKGNVDVNCIIDEFNATSLIKYMNVYKIGIDRNASDILKDQNNKKSETVTSLSSIMSMTDDFLNHLVENNFYEYGKLLDVYWDEKKKLSNKMSTDKVDSVYAISKNKFGILGGKVIGAGGGGFLMLFGEPDENLDKFMLQNHMPKLNFAIDTEGLKVYEL